MISFKCSKSLILKPLHSFSPLSLLKCYYYLYSRAIFQQNYTFLFEQNDEIFVSTITFCRPHRPKKINITSIFAKGKGGFVYMTQPSAWIDRMSRRKRQSRCSFGLFFHRFYARAARRQLCLYFVGVFFGFVFSSILSKA